MDERELEIWLAGMMEELRALPTEEQRRERLRLLVEWALEHRQPGDRPSVDRDAA
jgi:hypothetical protein